MTFCSELGQSLGNQFVALILDNEVTVSHFVTSPPLPWNRLIQHDGKFQIGAGYPTRLTSQQARFEMRHWGQVSFPAIMRALAASTIPSIMWFRQQRGPGTAACQELAVRFDRPAWSGDLWQQPAGNRCL